MNLKFIPKYLHWVKLPGSGTLKLTATLLARSMRYPSPLHSRATLGAEGGVLLGEERTWNSLEASRFCLSRAFGPIVRETTMSRKLYSQILGMGFKEETGGYLHTEALSGPKTSLSGLFRKPRSPALDRFSGREIPAPQAWLSLTLTAWKGQRRSLNYEAITSS